MWNCMVYLPLLCRSTVDQLAKRKHFFLKEDRTNYLNLSHFIFAISTEHRFKQLQVSWIVIYSFITCSNLSQIQMDGSSQEKTENTWFVS